MKKLLNRQKRHNKIRATISGTATCPRLCVYRSNNATYAQLIDDSNNKVIASSSDLKSEPKTTKLEAAKNVGINIGKIAIEQKISAVVFDRNGYKYHGRVKAVAEGARESGLKF